MKTQVVTATALTLVPVTVRPTAPVLTVKVSFESVLEAVLALVMTNAPFLILEFETVAAPPAVVSLIVRALVLSMVTRSITTVLPVKAQGALDFRITWAALAS